MPEASTLTSSSPSPGGPGSRTSTILRFSGGPGSNRTQAFLYRSSPGWANSPGHAARRSAPLPTGGRPARALRTRSARRSGACLAELQQGEVVVLGAKVEELGPDRHVGPQVVRGDVEQVAEHAHPL